MAALPDVAAGVRMAVMVATAAREAPAVREAAPPLLFIALPMAVVAARAGTVAKAAMAAREA